MLVVITIFSPGFGAASAKKISIYGFILWLIAKRLDKLTLLKLPNTKFVQK